MNISKAEQRVLHELALGGAIHFERLSNGKVGAVRCITREGYALSDCTRATFERLRKRRFIKSKGGAPYRVTNLGITSVRAQMDQR